MTVEEAAKQYNATKADVANKIAQEVKQAEPAQGPRIIEGNTGTLTVMLLDQLTQQMAKVLQFIEEVKQEKV